MHKFILPTEKFLNLAVPYKPKISLPPPDPPARSVTPTPAPAIAPPITQALKRSGINGGVGTGSNARKILCKTTLNNVLINVSFPNSF